MVVFSFASNACRYYSKKSTRYDPLATHAQQPKLWASADTSIETIKLSIKYQNVIKIISFWHSSC